jgi:hypothetical protein
MKIKMTLPVRCVSMSVLGDIHNVEVWDGTKIARIVKFFFLRSGVWNETRITTHLPRARTPLHRML